MHNGLKISPKECQLFKTDFQYMGNTIVIRNKRVCVRPLRSRIEAIQKLEPPTTIKGCRSFVGMVNFVSIFCPELQTLLKPIYDLTRNEKQFIWEKNNKRPLMRSNRDYKDLQSYIYLTDMDGSNCIQTLASFPMVACCTRSRMPMQAKECQRQLRITLLQNSRCVD